MKKLNTHMMTVMALLIALIVVLYNIFAIDTQFLKVTFSFVPSMIMGTLFGPLWTAVGSVLADLIGNTLFAKAPFFIGFTLNKLIEGLLYGYFFYRKPVTWKNTILCTLSITLLINLCLTPLWLAMMYHVPMNSWVIWAPRLIKAACMLPIQVGILYVVGSYMPMKRLLGKVTFTQ